MANPILSFVDAPIASPTTLVALNPSDALYVTAEDFDPGVPTFEAAPDSVGGVYGFREASFKVVLKGAYSAVAASQQAIAQQLVAARNWLMLDMGGTSKKMFLRTHRTAQASLAWQQSDFGEWELPVALQCDPFICGQREDLATHTVANGVTGTDFMYSVTGIKGDAPAPTVIWTPTLWSTFQPAFLGCSTVAPVFIEAETGANGTATTSVTATATYSNSAGKLFTPTGTSNTDRITGLTIPAGTPAGAYRVFARVKKSVAGDVFTASFAVTGLALAADDFTTQADTEFQIVDMGLFSVPEANAGYAGVLATAAISINIVSARVSGTGTLGFDWFALVPASGETTTEGWGSPQAGTTGSFVFDSRTSDTYSTTNASGPFDPTVAVPLLDNGVQPKGGFPRLWPGVTNYLTYLRTDPIPLTTTTSLRGSYWPQYLHIRPDST